MLTEVVNKTEDRKPSLVEQNFCLVDKTLDRLQELVGVLRCRLVHVMTPEGPECLEEGADVLPSECSVASNIRQLANRVSGVNDTVDGIINSLEI